MPLPVVALPCGSRSMTSTRLFRAASEAARLTVVVVLPTPPFWLATAMMFALMCFAGWKFYIAGNCTVICLKWV